MHEKRKLTTRERIERLKDDGAEIFELGMFVNDGVAFGKLQSPAAGVVTVITRIHDRLCMVIANDNTVASGAWWPQTPEKIQRAQEIARRLRLPTVYLVDCSGLYLPEQSRSFAGRRGAGHIFKMNSLLSAEGVPQLAGVFGDCIAGGGYMPIISDRVYMTENAYMVIAGAALIKGAKSQKLTSLDIGGPEVHVHLSRCADERVPDDETLIERLRQDVEKLPTSAADYYRGGVTPMAPVYPASELSALIPTDHREVYDANQVLARLCDQSLFWEVLPEIGKEMIVGIGRIGGLPAGLIINRQGLIDRPDGSKAPGGILYKEGIAKLSAFSRACDADGIPIIWLQDISGFDIGRGAEEQGLLGYGSNLIYTNSTNTVPMFSVLLRKASGAGYYAMAGHPYDPVLQLSTPLTRLSVMEGRTLAIASYNSKLDDDFEIVATDASERAAIEKGMREVQARIEADMDPYASASRMDTDEVVDLDELRAWLEVCVEASYQGYGYRRVKNSRIWAMHDLDLLGSGTRAVAQSRSASKDRVSDPTDEYDGQPVFRAPMSGRFYLQRAPGEPPFVQVGDNVAQGQTLFLLEVMKTFNRIALNDSNLPTSPTIKAILPKDGDDLEEGQIVFVFESGK
ncbi:MAG: carboxyl transferase domain-containing protein [Polyangiales bacterium]